jgi:predicted MFS family arabinose efflux permease
MSVYLIAYAVTSPLSGPLAGRIGAVPLMATGLVLAGGGSLLFATTDSLAIFLLARALVGIGTGLVYAPGLGLAISQAPARLATTAVGVYLAFLSVGITVAFLLTPLLEDSSGWAAPFWVAGAAVLAGTLVFVALCSGARATRAGARAQPVSPRTLAGNRPFVALSAVLFASMFATYGVQTWIPPYLDESAGFSAGQISLALTLATVLGIPAPLLVGWLADRTGRPLTVAGAGIGLGATVIVLAVVDVVSYGLATLVTVVATVGVIGGLIPLFTLPAIVVPRDALEVASGIATASAMTGAIIATFVGGALVGATDGYTAAFVLYTAVTAIAVGVLMPWAAATMRGRFAAPAAESR